MDGNENMWLAPLIAFLVPAIGWGFREYWRHRNAKRQAAGDAGKILSDKKKLLEELRSKAENRKDVKNLDAQIAEVNAALLGLNAQRLRQTLKDAGLPTEEMLIADGQSRLTSKDATQLSKAIEKINAPPLFLSTQDLLVLGSAYYHMQKYENALKIYSEILKSNPTDPVALTSRGVTYHALERYEEAIADFNHSLKLRPDDPAILENRAITYNKMGKYDEAIADLDRSLERRPEQPKVLHNRGFAYVQLKRYEEAIADFNHSLKLRPDNPDTLCTLGGTYIMVKKYDKALPKLNQALKIMPEHVGSLTNRGIVYHNLNRYNEALADLNRSLELKPNDETALSQRGLLYLKMHKPSKAFADFARTPLRSELIDTVGFYGLARILSISEQNDDAIVYLEKAISTDKKFREIAKTDKDFDNIRDDPRFKKLVGE